MAHFKHTPEVFADKSDYVKHLEDAFEDFHDEIIQDKTRFSWVRNIGLGISAVLVVIIIMRIATPDNHSAIPVIGITASILFILLLIEWLIVRNLMIHHHRLKLREYAHRVEELEDEYKRDNIESPEDERWWETRDAVIHKSEAIIRKSREEESHFRRYITHIGYLIVVAILLLILKFIFKIA